MIFGSDLKYRHIKNQLNQYKVYYHGDLIGEVRYTPGSCGTWTFTSSRDEAQTFGSTRLQAAGFYIEQFLKGEREHVTEAYCDGIPKEA